MQKKYIQLLPPTQISILLKKTSPYKHGWKEIVHPTFIDDLKTLEHSLLEEIAYTNQQNEQEIKEQYNIKDDIWKQVRKEINNNSAAIATRIILQTQITNIEEIIGGYDASSKQKQDVTQAIQKINQAYGHTKEHAYNTFKKSLLKHLVSLEQTMKTFSSKVQGHPRAITKTTRKHLHANNYLRQTNTTTTIDIEETQGIQEITLSGRFNAMKGDDIRFSIDLSLHVNNLLLKLPTPYTQNNGFSGKKQYVMRRPQKTETPSNLLLIRDGQTVYEELLIE